MTTDQRHDSYPYSPRLLSVLMTLIFLTTLSLVLRPFLLPLLWSVTLATSTWPALAIVRAYAPHPPYVAPLVMTLLLSIALMIIIVPIPLRLIIELQEISFRLQALNLSQVQISIFAIPHVGPLLSELTVRVFGTPLNLSSLLAEHHSAVLYLASVVAQGAIAMFITALASLLGCYLLYRNGTELLRQFEQILKKIGGSNIPTLLETVTITVRGAAYSVIATALVQGVLAGVGYLLAGAPTPILLGLLTMVVALIPFGAPLIYIPVAAYLFFFSGLPWYHGAGLAVWGICVVSTVDNLLRALLITQATKLPAVLVFMGVLGGIAAFGSIGIFIGPALMAVAHWFWYDFAQTARELPAERHPELPY